MPSGALAAQRLSLLMSLGACATEDDLPTEDSVLSGPIDVTNSPTTLSFGPEYGAAHRGAVVGNVAIWAGEVVVGFALTLVVRAVEKRGAAPSAAAAHTADRHSGTIVGSAAELRLPGLFFIVVALFFQQVVVSSALLLAYPGPAWEAADGAIGGCGLFLSCVIVFSTLRVLDPRSQRFRAVAVDADPDELHELHHDLFPQRRVLPFWRRRVLHPALYAGAWLRAEKVCWTARSHRHGDGIDDGLFVERYGYLFEGCNRRRHWWVVVEMASTIVLGGLSVVIPQTIVACLAVTWASVAVSALQLLATIVCRPMNSLFENVIVHLLASVQTAVALCSALDAPPLISYGLSILSTVLSSLLVLAALLHMLGTRLRGVSMLLRRKRSTEVDEPMNRQRVPCAESEGNDSSHRLWMSARPHAATERATKQPWDQEATATLRFGTDEERALESLNLTKLIAMICSVQRSANTLCLQTGPIGCVGVSATQREAQRRHLSVRFVERPRGREHRRIIVPELPPGVMPKDDAEGGDLV
jgi:hypothetical protein